MKAAGVDPGGGVCLQYPFFAVPVTSIGAANLANDSGHHVSLSFNFDVRPRPGYGLLLGLGRAVQKRSCCVLFDSLVVYGTVLSYGVLCMVYSGAHAQWKR